MPLAVLQKYQSAEELKKSRFPMEAPEVLPGWRPREATYQQLYPPDEGEVAGPWPSPTEEPPHANSDSRCRVGSVQPGNRDTPFRLRRGEPGAGLSPENKRPD